MHTSVRYAGVHAQKSESMHYHSGAMILCLSARMQNTRSEFLFLIKLGYWVLVRGGWMVTVRRSTLLGLFEPQLDQKKISTPGFLHCNAQRESKGIMFLEFQGTTSR